MSGGEGMLRRQTSVSTAVLDYMECSSRRTSTETLLELGDVATFEWWGGLAGGSLVSHVSSMGVQQISRPAAGASWTM